ncbi:MAG: hypothetical protein SVY53_12075 [Chloroflexota bacterium]|nr:hypothetical protein [Chloroflexota bacterium]
MLAEDERIVDELIEKLSALPLTADTRTLFRIGTDSPTTLTAKYRIQELTKLKQGLPSPWGETELEAEKRYRLYRQSRKGVK